MRKNICENHNRAKIERELLRLPDVRTLQPQIPRWRKTDELAGARFESHMPLVLEARWRGDFFDFGLVGFGNVEAGFVAFPFEEVHISAMN